MSKYDDLEKRIDEIQDDFEAKYRALEHVGDRLFAFLITT